MSRRRKVTNSCVTEAGSDLCESCAFKADTCWHIDQLGIARQEETGRGHSYVLLDTHDGNEKISLDLTILKNANSKTHMKRTHRQRERERTQDGAWLGFWKSHGVNKNNEEQNCIRTGSIQKQTKVFGAHWYMARPSRRIYENGQRRWKEKWRKLAKK